MLINNNKTK